MHLWEISWLWLKARRRHVFACGAFAVGLKSGFSAEKLIDLIVMKNYAEAFGQEDTVNLKQSSSTFADKLGKFLGRQPLKLLKVLQGRYGESGINIL